ncbi:hypothetical protein R3P38DRAFT_1075359 [Favolaschia claudopus]|uniref:Uncharacterized protein n=1 Tax=Favolaschia claudopus TaxID=2862362 RepID=A0AAW0BC60_9AGAR
MALARQSRLRSSPVRRLMSKLKPSSRQSARHQEPVPHGKPDLDPVVDTPPENPSPHDNNSSAKRSRACMALQNDDLFEDAVVITTLSTLPFCCHEDLITMSRPSLVAVAESLNAKLPNALQISVDRRRTSTALRHDIELVVGIRTEMPVASAHRAPRGKLLQGQTDSCSVNSSTLTTLSRLQMWKSGKWARTPPCTPSTRRARRMFPIYGTPGTARLERLAEEEEEEDRPLKRQRTRSVFADEEESMNVDAATTTPTPMPRADRMRSRSGFIPALASPTPPPRVLRSHSTILPGEVANTEVDIAFIDMNQRPRYRKRDDGGRRIASQPMPGLNKWVPKQKVRAGKCDTQRSTGRRCGYVLVLVGVIQGRNEEAKE